MHLIIITLLARYHYVLSLVFDLIMTVKAFIADVICFRMASYPEGLKANVDQTSG